MTLTETVLLSFLWWSLDKVLFPGVFQEMILFKRSGILEERCGAVQDSSKRSCFLEIAIPRCL